MAKRKYTGLEIRDFTNKEKGQNHGELWKAFISLNLDSLEDVDRFCSEYHVLPPGDYTETGFNAASKASHLRPIQNKILIIINALEEGLEIPKQEWDSIQDYLKTTTHYRYITQSYKTERGEGKHLIYGETTCKDSIAAIYISFMDAAARLINADHAKMILANFNTCEICDRRFYYKVVKSEKICSKQCWKDYRAKLGRKNYKPKPKK